MPFEFIALYAERVTGAIYGASGSDTTRYQLTPDASGASWCHGGLRSSSDFSSSRTSGDRVMADFPAAAMLPQSLIDELPNVVAAIHPAVHSASSGRRADDAGGSLGDDFVLRSIAPCAPVELLVEAAIRMAGWHDRRRTARTGTGH